ncbi:modular serine protease-like [Anastrepha ludens]|uniref:modular serine protease-like n=1 Tax=Anastrepha ludens TaxID=28586 RepID=UPI0023AF22CF|nr:modular serine protease-like [Anastrepha ludens]
MICSIGTHFPCTPLINIYLIALWLLIGGCSAQSECNWKCDDGESIDCEYFCDGLKNCRDGSDESTENCFVNSTCPSYAFRCAYGACIMGENRCNGKQDCADNSDELPFLCEKTRQEVEVELRGKCGDAEMQCSSGECIDSDKVCDGIRDCRLGDDETLEKCAPFSCPTFAHKCAYGACIEGKAACNGTVECHDGSDEAYALCGMKRKDKPKTDIVYFPTDRTMVSAKLKPPPTTTLAVNERCKIPENLANVIIRDELRGTNLQVGSKVPTNTVVSFACHPGFNLVGDIRTFCRNRGWQNNLPTCIKYCNATMLQEGFSTKATCYFENVLVPCRNIRPGTSAVISCETDYQRKNVWEETTLTCTNEYQWNNPKTPCEIRCGYIQQPSTAFASNGRMVNVTQAPWHVGVYSKLNQRDFKRTCGGSIVSTRIVVSAAHCVWDEANSATYPAGLFKVAAAQLASRYITTEGSDVSYIYVPSSYTGADGNYQDDLAILKVVNIFKFTETVKPICFEPKNRAAAVVENDELGFIVGWGPTTSSNNVDVFQKIDVSSISYQSCLDRLTINDTPYDLPTDKFCVRRVARTGDICRGDSGGGFVKNIRGRYYLVGVVSHAPLRHIDCGRDGLVALTNVQFYTQISKYIDGDKDRVVQQNVAM